MSFSTKIKHVSRIVQLLISVALIFMLVYLVHSNQAKFKNLVGERSNMLIKDIINQTIDSIGPILKLEDQPFLQALSDKLVERPDVVALTIYDAYGNEKSFSQSIGKNIDKSEITNILDDYVTYSENVFYNGEKLGFFVIRLQPEKLLNSFQDFYKEEQRQEIMMIIVAILIGFLLARNLSYKRAYINYLRTNKKRY